MTLRERFARFFEQNKALVGDAAYSFFNDGLVLKPREDSTYKYYYENDATVGVSIDALSNMRLGSGIYATVKDAQKSQKALDLINELNERIHLDEQLQNIDKCLDIYGRCPVERVTRRGPPGGILELLVLDPSSVEYKRAVHGQFLGFLQKVGGKSDVKFGPDELVWFCNNQAGNGKRALYGLSRVQRVLPLLEIREQIVKNINGIMSKQARPPLIWKVKGENDVATLKALLKSCKTAGTDPIVYPLDSVQFEVVKTDTKAAYWEYVDYIDGLIFQGLHSPMLNYLRNATEASANTMLDVIKADVEGRQRYLKRMVEHEFWEWHLRKRGWEGEIPSLNFGSPKTGLEDLNVDTFLTKGLELNFIDQQGFYDILQQKGLKINFKPVAEEPAGAHQITITSQDDPEKDLVAQERKARIAALNKIAAS
ncbi:MAG: hypothetical protein ACQCN6_01755 [Candidatus Bathyarchaeia archaeon]|jgi:hypothetical protein